MLQECGKGCINTSMKLNEVKNLEPIFAWLEPSKGPEDIQGVRLAFVEPLVPQMDKMIQFAKEEHKPDRAERLERMKKQYLEKGHKFFTPDIDWWMNEEHFNTDKPGVRGKTRGQLLNLHPNLYILPSREQAIKKAKEAGII